MDRPSMRWPWFAPVFALYPVLHVAATNPGETEAGSVFFAAVTVVAAALLLLALLRPLLGSWYRAGLATTWIAILFFSYGVVCQWAEGLVKLPDALDFALLNDDPGFRLHLSIAWALLLVLGVALARRLPLVGRRASGALNLVAAILLAMVAARWIATLPESGRGDVAPSETVAWDGPRPDVYFIVLDGYARADMLAKYYGFDNRPFLDALHARGFSVQDASTSNYYWTDLSLPSMLNFDYLPSLLGPIRERAVNRQGVYDLIRDNQAARFLRARGYRFVHFQSTWGATGANPFADEFVNCSSGVFRDDYVRALAQITWLYAVSSRASLHLARCHLNNFERLGAQGGAPGPKFVFAHFLPPHHPYLFDREGRVLRDAKLSDQFDFQTRLWSEKAPYLEQLQFVNARILAAIGRLIAESPQAPLIVIQSDHGPSLDEYEAPERRRIRFATLSAVLLPGAPEGWMPADVTAVNLFPHIFNRAFGASLPMHAPRYFTSEFEHPFMLREVGPDGVRLEPPPAAADNL